MEKYSFSAIVNLSFDRALQETRLALEEEEFLIIAEIDLQAQLSEKLNREIRPYTILGVWVPSWECEALSQEPDAGLLMPSHVCLWDNGNGTCTLVTPNRKHICQLKENPPLANAARAVNARLRAVMATLEFIGLTTKPNS